MKAIAPASLPVVAAPPSPAPPVVATANEFHGHGGSYRMDPATGKTELISRSGHESATTKPEKE